jgi:HAD superfamily hydrolase (TIGR01509 family)
MTPRPDRVVLFDLDGTLVDTRDAVVASYRMVFDRHLGGAFPPTGLPAELFAMRPREVFAHVAPDRVEALYAAYEAAYPQCLAQIRIFAGAAALIQRLQESGRKPGLVTNKGRPRTLIDLSVAGIDAAALSVLVTAEDTERRKPDPAPIRHALALLGLAPEQALYVGDGPQDIRAARAAGMECIAVSYGFYPAETLAALRPAALAASVPALASALGLALEPGPA